MMKFFWTAGCVAALIGVALGAFAAHGLQHRLDPPMLRVFETGARYQMYHAFGLLAVGLMARHVSNRIVFAAGWLFCAGILLFSGSLYLLALTGAGWWGAVAPVGGLAFLAGWACLALGHREG